MNAITTNSAAPQSPVLGMQNTSIHNQEQKQEKTQVSQSRFATESNNKKAQGAAQERQNNVGDKNNKVTEGRSQALRQESLSSASEQTSTHNVSKGKSEEARAIVRFESMLQKQEVMESNQSAKSEADVAYNEATEEQKFDDAAAMEIVAKQQQAFDARYAYGALADSASVKNIQSLASNQENYNNKASTKSMTGELKVEKFVAPVPITEIKAPIAPADHLYVLTEATERAAEDVMNKQKDSEVLHQTNQKPDANVTQLSLVSMNDKNAQAQLESAPEGTKSPHNADAPELSYGLAS